MTGNDSIVNRCCRPFTRLQTLQSKVFSLRLVYGSVKFWNSGNNVTVLCLLILQILVFSLGRALQRAVKNTDLEVLGQWQ